MNRRNFIRSAFGGVLGLLGISFISTPKVIGNPTKQPTILRRRQAFESIIDVDSGKVNVMDYGKVEFASPGIGKRGLCVSPFYGVAEIPRDMTGYKCVSSHYNLSLDRRVFEWSRRWEEC